MFDVRGKIDRSICVAGSVCCFVFSWTYFGITDDYVTFYHLLAICCFTLYFGLFLPVKYRVFWDQVQWVAFLFTFNNLLDEFGDYIIPDELVPYIFNPREIQINEYIFAILTVIMVIRAKRKNWKTQSYAEYFRQTDKCKLVEKEP